MHDNEQKNNLHGRYTTIRRIFWATIGGWTLLLICLGGWDVYNVRQEGKAILLSEARAFFQLIVTTRAWNASHGGVYVPVSKSTPPNPYLVTKNRDLEVRPGMTLTLLNPAYMTRQISEMIAARSNIKFHITSLNPIRPGNAADAWEASALKKFEAGAPDYYQWMDQDSETGSQFRYMAPLATGKSCLPCHGEQGYKEGDLRGGISVSLPAGSVLQARLQHEYAAYSIYAAIWIFGMLATITAFRMLKGETDRREELIGKLHQALKDVKTLNGMIPICASCKNIRNDKGYWERIEKYILERSEAEFTHSICPTCMQKLYPELVETKEEQL